jgi:hypothetical protein
MVTKIKPIKKLDNLKNKIPDIVILVHKDPEKAFTLIGKPHLSDLDKSLEFEPYLLLNFVIDIPSSTFYEEISAMYTRHISEIYTKLFPGEEKFIYDKNSFSKKAKIELYELINE